GLDAGGEQRVHQPVVERESGAIDRSRSEREDAAPGNAEPIGAQAELAHELHIVWPAVIMIGGDVTRLAIRGAPRGVREAMPDARSRTVGERRTFDLIGGRGGSPEEAFGKAASGWNGVVHVRGSEVHG